MTKKKSIYTPTQELTINLTSTGTYTLTTKEDKVFYGCSIHDVIQEYEAWKHKEEQLWLTT